MLTGNGVRETSLEAKDENKWTNTVLKGKPMCFACYFQKFVMNHYTWYYENFIGLDSSVQSEHSYKI